MKNFRNNYKRNRFRNNNDRSFKNNNGSIPKFNTEFTVNSDGDKILSENYYQHADHFQRIWESQNAEKIDKKNLNNETDDIKDQKNIINT